MRYGKNVTNNINEQEWVEYFMKLLEGSKEKKLGESRKIDQVMLEENKLEDWEIKKAWNGLKKNKAARYDRIPNEAWIHGDRLLKEVTTHLFKKIWDGGEIPEDWKVGTIVPLYKKGKTEEESNYRGMLPTAYNL